MPTLEHKGCNLYYIDEGPKEADVLIFTHGAMLDHRSWLQQINYFKDRYRVIAWDIPGHGRSKPLIEFTTIDCADKIIALMDKLGIEQATMIGLSTGGFVAQEAAYRYPERVAALACFDTTPVTFTKLGPMTTWFFENSTFFIRMMPYALLAKTVPSYVALNDDVRKYVSDAATLMNGKEFSTFWEGVARAMHFDPTYEFPLPLLIAYGDQADAGSIKEFAPVWAQKCPHAILVEIPNASHLSNQDNPEYTNKMLEHFFKTTANAQRKDAQSSVN